MGSSSPLRDLAPSRRRALVALATLVASAAFALPAAASNCGDKVDGERVPCRCGDVVVSDTVLWPTDPVSVEPCSGDGLILQAPTESDGITLNLGGQSIVGTGSGAGIRVARGGKLGSVIVGGDAEDARAEIANFDTGIRASGRNVLREVRAIDIHHNEDDGLKLRTSGVVITDVRADNNGRDGASLAGHGIEVSGVTAAGNIRDGLQLRGTGAKIEAETSGNLRNGTVVGGRGNQVKKVRSEGNGAAGVVATGAGHEVEELDAAENPKGEVTGRPGALQ